jgi:hypothetical protein
MFINNFIFDVKITKYVNSKKWEVVSRKWKVKSCKWKVKSGKLLNDENPINLKNPNNHVLTKLVNG